MSRDKDLLIPTLKLLIENEVSPQDVANDDEYSSVEKQYLMKEYIKNLNGQEIELDVIDKYQKVIFSWGCDGADKVFTPIEPHHFLMLIASAGVGKTAYTFDLGIKNAKRGANVLYLSLEMTTDNIFTRMARKAAGITKFQWQDRKRISDSQRRVYKEKKEELRTTPLFTPVGLGGDDDKSLQGILNYILDAKPDMVFVDNLDLIDKGRAPTENAHYEAVTKAFMDFCKKEQIAVILIHHLNKAHDIRGSQKIKDNCTGMFSCFRETENLESLEEIDRRMFIVSEKKDREFGEPGAFTYYFAGGTFLGTFEEAIDAIHDGK